MIEFLLDQQRVRLAPEQADLTVLDYLREQCGLRGTKEGCATGDCGACTVVTAELEQDELRYRNRNSCITFLGALHGKQLITVEHLAENGNLHPVQQAMVDQHGSQCGFCTPGFVMSLFALYKAGDLKRAQRARRRHVDEFLGGNLCRCTGYRPIIAAARQSLAAAARDRFSARRSSTLYELKRIARSRNSGTEQFFLPRDCRQVSELLKAHPGARLLAGGTDLALEVTWQLRSLEKIIYLGNVRELNRVRSTKRLHEFGAGVSLDTLMKTTHREYPDLERLLLRFGSRQIRNAGSIGGNLANASPIGDLPPVFMALDADIILQRGAATRTVAARDFFTGYRTTVMQPGEFIRAVRLPRGGVDLRIYKLSKRIDDDISTLCMAAAVRLEKGVLARVNIAFGGMAEVPKRATACEQALLGQPLTPAVIDHARAALERDFQPIDDVRASADYRMKAAKNLLNRLHLELGGNRRRPGWLNMTEVRYNPVGRALPHESARKHVTGEAVYVDDMPRVRGQVHACVGGSTLAHGDILGMDLEAVRRSEGVIDVITAADVPGQLDIGPVYPGDPLLADGVVEYLGQPLFAVAAQSHAQARKAVAKAAIEYREKTPVLDLEQAMRDRFYVRPPHRMRRGDARKALADAPNRVRGELRVGGQEQFYLEGQVSMAAPGEDGGMTVYSSTQNPTEIQKLVAEVLGLPMNHVDVETRRMGGGFGGKETHAAAWACIAALFAARLTRPVSCRLPRRDDMLMTGKRHNFLNRYQAGFDARGVIRGIRHRLAAQCGYSPDLSDAIVDRAMFHCDNAYYLADVEIEGLRCKTHTVSNTAFRGFGGPQGMIAMETVIDEIAFALDLDPLEVRKRNLYDTKKRNVTPYHQVIEHFNLVRLIEQLEDEGEYWKRRKAVRRFNDNSPVIKKGLALTPVKFGISFTSAHLNQAGALVHVYSDGSIHVNHGGTEMGQGLMTKIAQIVAEEFQVDPGRVIVSATRTDKVPNTSPTAASSGTDINGMAARNAARTVRGRMAAFLAEQHGVAESAVRFAGGRVHAGGRRMAFAEAARRAWFGRVSLSATGFYRTPGIHYDRKAASGAPFFYFATGAAISEVAVDTLTGEHKLERVDILHDVGDSINPAVDLGQVEGGFIQGVGWLTCEELKWDANGRLLTDGPATYKIPAIGDAPEAFNVRLSADTPNERETIFRSKAVGEPPLMLAISTWCAIRDAVAAVAGHRVFPPLNAPATPEEVLRVVTLTRERGA